MSALPPEQMRALRQAADAARQPLGSLTGRWQELHRQAGELAAMAGLAAEAPDCSPLSAMLEQASEWQRELACQGIEDIAAMMRPGLAALVTLSGRGQDATAPALALWREFHAARAAVLGLLEPLDTALAPA